MSNLILGTLKVKFPASSFLWGSWLVSVVVVGSLFMLVGATGFARDTEEARGNFVRTSTGGWTGCAGYHGVRATGFVGNAEKARGMPDI